MPSSPLASLLELPDSGNVSEIASRVGEPAEAVGRSLDSIVASLISGLATRSVDAYVMSQVYRLISQAAPEADVAHLTDAVLGFRSTTSTLGEDGRKLVAHAFGEEEPSVMDAITRFVELRPPVVSTLMGVAAPVLTSSLARIVRREHMTQAQLTDLLVAESASVQNLLPPELQHSTRRPAETRAADSGRNLFSITTVREHEQGLPSWLWVFLVLLLIPFTVWWFNWAKVRRASETERRVENIGARATDIGNFAVRQLPGNVELEIPTRGVESKLLGFIQDPTQTVSEAPQFDFDRLYFEVDSAHLRPESREQLRNIAAILDAYPNVSIRLGGYTDQTGNAEQDLRLSEARAGSVAAELINLGISPDRLEARGYGDQYPIADNSTDEGRARNRRISVCVTQK